MLRLTELESGAICIDGTNISRISLARLRRGVAYIPQTPFLFEVQTWHDRQGLTQALTPCLGGWPQPTRHVVLDARQRCSNNVHMSKHMLLTSSMRQEATC